MTESAKPVTRHAVMREILVALFATPAALSVLAKLDSRLDFASLLERIILNFDRVTREIWDALSAVIRIDLSRYYEFLTFAVLMIAPVLVARARIWLMAPADGTGGETETGAADEKPKEPLGDLIPIAAGAFVLFLAWLFRIGDSLLFLLPFVYLAIGIVALSALAGGWRKAFWWGVAGIAFVAAGVYELWMGISGLARWDAPLDVKFVFLLFSVIGVVLVFKALSESTKTLAYVAFWVAGIVAVNWIATVAIPGIDLFLRDAGA